MAKILIIDDDKTVHVVYKIYLSKEGHVVEMALDGKAGLEKVNTFKPDLILLDVNMPRMSGFEVAKRLKEKSATRNIPIFMMTALNQDVNIKRGYKLGIEEYITKPINIEHLKLRIAKFLEKK